MRLVRPLLVTVLLLGFTAPAYADFTFIIGSNRTPSSRAVKGFAIGGGSMIATEFEYANNGEDLDDEEGPTPGLRPLHTERASARACALPPSTRARWTSPSSA